MHEERRGEGAPLVLVHGLGGSWRSWGLVLDALAREREVVAIDMPGFGDSPPLSGPVTIASLADALAEWLGDSGLESAGLVGCSVGARLVLELARRGHAGAVVALDPGGFWNDRERAVFGTSIGLSIKLVDALQGPMPALMGNPVTRTALLAQLSARPWALPGDFVLTEMRSFARAESSEELLRDLVSGPRQEGMPPGRALAPATIGWGRNDLVTLPRQAPRAQRAFPDAELVWFDRCGHSPHWDRPDAAAELILQRTGSGGG